MVRHREVAQMMRESVVKGVGVDEWKLRGYVDEVRGRGGNEGVRVLEGVRRGDGESGSASERAGGMIDEDDWAGSLAGPAVEVLSAADAVLKDVQYAKIDPNFVVVDVVGAVLETLGMDDILRVYPEKSIVAALKSPAPQMAKLAMQIVEAKVADDRARAFVESSGFMRTVFRLYLSERESAVEVLASIESLLRGIAAKRPQWMRALVCDDDTRGLMSSARADSEGTLVARLLDYILAVLPAFPSDSGSETIPAPLYVFQGHEIKHCEDPLLVVLVIQFYAKLVQQLEESFKPSVFENVKPCMRALAEVYATRTEDSTVSSFYANEIVEVVRVLSISSNPEMSQFAMQLVEEFGISQPYNLNVTVYESDLRLLSTVNPVVLGASRLMEVVQEVPVLHKKYIPILLNALRSKESFAMLVDAQKLTIDKLSKFSKDLLYQVLLEFSKHDYAIAHLVNNMPTIISKFLVNDTNELTEPEIWSLKKDTLFNLLHSDSDLMYWEDSLSKSYRIMVNGRSYVDIEPSVDIATDFGQ